MMHNKEHNMTKIKNIFFLFFLSLFLYCHTVHTVDMVVFSYNRPMQLYAFLESSEKYLSGLSSIQVIYRVSDEGYDKAYDQVKGRFAKVQFHKQATSANDFKEKVCACVKNNPACPYVVFAVDDIIVKDEVDLEVCTKALEEHKAHGFFLRLGKNINHCYMVNAPTPCPEGQNIGSDLFLWQFSQGGGDWRYPNNLDMTVYRKKDLGFFEHGPYHNPNILEGEWAAQGALHLNGLCFDTSKIVNIPMNLVNPSANRFNRSYTAAELLALFQKGLKIDISQFHKINNVSPHADYTVTFIPR